MSIWWLRAIIAEVDAITSRISLDHNPFNFLTEATQHGF